MELVTLLSPPGRRDLMQKMDSSHSECPGAVSGDKWLTWDTSRMAQEGNGSSGSHDSNGSAGPHGGAGSSGAQGGASSLGNQGDGLRSQAGDSEVTENLGT